ncbi:hypothetical protein DFH28DRAFT_1131022 [Melampsora americana]|nr:hypothetical protein DFH28DRAFT_1131022 [Melampsora americana]
MCRKITKVVYGTPLPAISLLHAASTLEDTNESATILKAQRGKSWLPTEILELIAYHLVAGHGAVSKSQWKAGLTTASHHCREPCEWCFLLRADDLIEASTSDGDIRIQNLNKCLSRPEFRFELASKTPIRTTIAQIENAEGLQKSQSNCEERIGEPVWVVCLRTAAEETSNINVAARTVAQVAEVDFSDCPVDLIEGPATFIEPASFKPSPLEDENEECTIRLEKLLATCDLLLDSPHFSFSECRKLLRWWTVTEIECECL